MSVGTTGANANSSGQVSSYTAAVYGGAIGGVLFLIIALIVLLRYCDQSAAVPVPVVSVATDPKIAVDSSVELTTVSRPVVGAEP